MCAISLGWRHLINAYGVKAEWFIPFVDKRVGGRYNCVIPLTRAIPERIRLFTTMRYTNRRLLYLLYFTIRVRVTVRVGFMV